VFWDTPQSTKSFFMIFFAACVVRHPAMKTIPRF
jgi:hypothetical protein